MNNNKKILNNFLKVLAYQHKYKTKKKKFIQIDKIKNLKNNNLKKYRFVTYKIINTNIIKIFLVILNSFFLKSLKKNFFIIFEYENAWQGNNFLPDWPGSLNNRIIFLNVYFWIKQFFYLFFFSKRIKYLIFESYDNSI